MAILLKMLRGISRIVQEGLIDLVVEVVVVDGERSGSGGKK